MRRDLAACRQEGFCGLKPKSKGKQQLTPPAIARRSSRMFHREIELMRGIHGLQPVVVVDEAHLLDREMLEEVRFLNF